MPAHSGMLSTTPKMMPRMGAKSSSKDSIPVLLGSSSGMSTVAGLRNSGIRCGLTWSLRPRRRRALAPAGVEACSGAWRSSLNRIILNSQNTAAKTCFCEYLHEVIQLIRRILSNFVLTSIRRVSSSVPPETSATWVDLQAEQVEAAHASRLCAVGVSARLSGTASDLVSDNDAEDSRWMTLTNAEKDVLGLSCRMWSCAHKRIVRQLCGAARPWSACVLYHPSRSGPRKELETESRSLLQRFPFVRNGQRHGSGSAEL